MTTNANNPAFRQSFQDIGSKLNHSEAIQLLQKAINRYRSFAPEVSKAIKAAEKRSIDEFYHFCDKLATEFYNEVQKGTDVCFMVLYGMDYELLRDSVKKVENSIDKHSPVEQFDVAVEFLGTCLNIIMKYVKSMDCDDEHMDIDLTDSIDAIQTTLEDVVKLWAARDKAIASEIGDLEESYGAGDQGDFWGFFEHLPKFYWSKRRIARRRMTVMRNRKKRTPILPIKSKT